MPGELRAIIFADHELVQAVQLLRSSRGAPLPPGTVAGLTLQDEPEISLSFEVQDDDGARQTRITVGATELCAAMILFCHRGGIPLPASWPKRLERRPQGLTLLLSREMPKARPMAAPARPNGAEAAGS